MIDGATQPATVTPGRADAPAWHAADVPVWVLGAVASCLVYLCSTQGLFTTGWLEAPALLAGAVAGLIVSRPSIAALVAAAAVLAALMIQPPWLFGDLAIGAPQWWRWVATVAGCAVAASLVASLGRAVLMRARPRWAGVGWEWLVVVACVAGVLWGATSTVAYRQRAMGVTAWLEAPAKADPDNDQDFYARTIWLMREHRLGFYPAYRQAHNENLLWRHDPAFFLSYRLPTTYELLSRLGARGIADTAVAWMAFGVVGATTLAALRARPALAVLSATIAAAVGTNLAASKFIVFAEFWAIPFVVWGVVLIEASRSARRWRALTVAGVATIVAACLFREIAGLVLIAGAIAALFAGRERRRFEVGAWSVGLVALGAALLAHFVVIGPAVNHEGAGWLLHPSLVNVAAALQMGTDRLASDWWLLVLIAVLGFAGVAAQRGSARIFPLLVIGLPLLAFAFLYNQGMNIHYGELVNYWGTPTNLVLYGLVPWALAALTGGAAVPETTGANR